MIHREGIQIILINTAVWVVLAALVLLFGESPVWKVIVSLLSLFMIAIVLLFFRVPTRQTTVNPEMIVSPADGHVVEVKREYVKEYFDCECNVISVFLSLFDVHITWLPTGGEVVYSKYYPGAHTFAFLPKSSEKNEHTSVVVRDGQGREVMFRQIAGIVARRVVCYANEGETFEQASEAGFIKFGSRLTIIVPADVEPLVEGGDKVLGSVTPLARFK